MFVRMEHAFGPIERPGRRPAEPAVSTVFDDEPSIQLNRGVSMKRIRLYVKLGVAMASLFAAGCSAGTDTEASGEEVTERIGTTSQAVVDVDTCAMGTTHNALAFITTQGALDTYQRPFNYIETLCPAQGKDRPVTIVDFDVNGAHQHVHRFRVIPSFWLATNITQCVGLRMATRIQRTQVGGLGGPPWVDVKYLEQHGVWTWDFSHPNQGTCAAPTFDYRRLNSADYYSSEASMYRVRTWAMQWDDSYASVWISGENEG